MSVELTPLAWRLDARLREAPVDPAAFARAVDARVDEIATARSQPARLLAMLAQTAPLLRIAGRLEEARKTASAAIALAELSRIRNLFVAQLALAQVIAEEGALRSRRFSSTASSRRRAALRSFPIRCTTAVPRRGRTSSTGAPFRGGRFFASQRWPQGRPRRAARDVRGGAGRTVELARRAARRGTGPLKGSTRAVSGAARIRRTPRRSIVSEICAAPISFAPHRHAGSARSPCDQEFPCGSLARYSREGATSTTLSSHWPRARRHGIALSSHPGTMRSVKCG